MLSERLVLGTAQARPGYGVTSRGVQQESVFLSMLNAAKQLDIKWIDTAKSYGSAESWIGKNNEFQFQIASKVSIKGRDTSSLKKDIEQSAIELGRNQLRVVFAHDWEESNSLDRKIFLSLQKDYSHLKFGISLYETSSLKNLLSNESALPIVQIPFSVLNQSFLPLLENCKDLGIEVWARSIFLQGAIDYHSNRNPFRDDPDIIKLADFCKRYFVTPFQVATSFVLSSSVDKIIVGSESASQLAGVVELFNSPEELTNLDQLVSTNLHLIDPRRWK
jgi:aryl-alcohol dehydrogenase-like predicted oxidoreductase